MWLCACGCGLKTMIIITGKLSYRKDDRAMHECIENFRESLTIPTAIFPEIFNGFFPIDAVNKRTKFEVRSFTHS